MHLHFATRSFEEAQLCQARWNSCVLGFHYSTGERLGEAHARGWLKANTAGQTGDAQDLLTGAYLRVVKP